MYEAGSDVANYIEEAAISAESKMETTTDFSTEDAYSNITLEDDPFGDDYGEISRSWFRYLKNYIDISIYIRLILCIFIVAATIFLATVILKFRKLRTRTNTYILHMCFVHIFAYMVPLLYMFLEVLFWWHFDGLVLFETLSTALSLYLTLAFMLGLDWFVFARKPHLEYLYTKIFNYVLFGVYVFFIIEWIAVFAYSEAFHVMVLRPVIFTAFYFAFAVALIVLNILKKQLSLNALSERTEYAITVANISIFSYIPFLIYHVVNEFAPYTSIHLYIFMCFLEPLPSIVALGHPVLIVHILGKQNKYFKMAYNKIFRRSVRSYADDNLDESCDEQGNIKVHASFGNETRIRIHD